VVFLVHDIADVPVDLSKLANFLKWKWTTLACFTVMTLVWLYTRLTILPFTIYRCTVKEGHYVLQEGIPVLCFLAYRHFFYVFLGLLILLHLAWFVMFLRMYYTFWVKMECHDLSEHKNGEEQQHHHHHQPNGHAPVKRSKED
jgi:TLC domain